MKYASMYSAVFGVGADGARAGSQLGAGYAPARGSAVDGRAALDSFRRAPSWRVLSGRTSQADRAEGADDSTGGLARDWDALG